jgi:hypothetical protein
MTKNAKSQLRQKIREYVAFSIDNELSTNDIVEKIISKYPELVELEKARLIRLSIGQLATKVMNAPQEVTQLSLPGMEKEIYLPARIPVRYGNRNGPASWLRWQSLNLAQLEQRIKELNKPSKINSDLDVLRKLRSLIKSKIKTDGSIDASSTIAKILGLEEADSSEQ